MIQSPWEQATALVTTEREGIRSQRQFALTSTQQSITSRSPRTTFPTSTSRCCSSRDAATGGRTEPRGHQRRGTDAIDDPSDPGKPAFRLGYVELKVEDATEAADGRGDGQQGGIPPATMRRSVDVKDAPQSAPARERGDAVGGRLRRAVADRVSHARRARIGLRRKALQVMNADNRQRIISRPRADAEGRHRRRRRRRTIGAGTLRKDFRVLGVLARLGDDRRRRPRQRRREAAGVAHDLPHHGGRRRSRLALRLGDAEVRINKPLTLKPTFPRFLAVGDKAHSARSSPASLKEAGEATVTIAASIRTCSSSRRREQTLRRAGGTRARFDGGGQGDRPRARPDDGAARRRDRRVRGRRSRSKSGVAGDRGRLWRARWRRRATETLTIPAGVVPGFGGLHVELSSTAMVGLGEGALPRRVSLWAARSSADRARSRCCWPPISATRSRCPAWTRRRCGRRCSRR